MPIIFIHGAGTREHYRRYHVDWQHVASHLRRYVAPVLAPDPENVPIIIAYWGDVGVRLAWDALSLPPGTGLLLHDNPLLTLLPVGQTSHILREIFVRGTATPGYWTSRAVGGLRRRQTPYTAVFIGDALHYLATRGTPERPGIIPLRIIEALARGRALQQARGGEPLIVMTHSLGGAILYDVLTTFLPHMPLRAEPVVDLWASLCSQIGLFEEMKLFLASHNRYGPGNPAPFPERRFLRAWWNAWDPHDLLSFTVRGIIADVDDGPFDSGLPLSSAHMSCLRLSSYYTVLARKINVNINLQPETPQTRLLASNEQPGL